MKIYLSILFTLINLTISQNTNALNMINLFEHWDVFGTGVLYYH